MNTPMERMTAGVAALGNFDGVHRGHQTLIALARAKAAELQVATAVVTFEPHPRRLFDPDQQPFRLTPQPAKTRLLQGLGVEQVVSLDFTRDFSRLAAMEFVDGILRADLAVRHVIAGEDFTFGYQRGGTMALLAEWLRPYGVGVTAVAPVRDGAGEVLSASRIRSALQTADLTSAAEILGRPWAIAGTIIPGARRARTLGFPTANMQLGDYLRPQFGVYAVMARRVGDPRHWPGVANIGLRPTVDGRSDSLEFHLFDFAADIYGEEWEVELHHYLRPEQAFGSLDALRAQITQDAATARAALAISR